MSYAVADAVRRDLGSGDLLDCVHGLSELDRACFETLTAADDPLTIDELADAADRERSTVYRAVHRLLDAGCVEKDQVNYEQGGYYHVYRPEDPDAVADEMARLVDEWNAMMAELVDQFREEYGEQASAGAVPG